MSDFLTTTFPAILILVLGSDNGQEQRIHLHMHPEFERYNMSLWQVTGTACQPYSAHMLKWRTVFVESSDILRMDHLRPGRYCVMADPITDTCWPPEFCSRIISNVIELTGFPEGLAGPKPCCYPGKVEANFQVEDDMHTRRSVRVSLQLKTLRNPCFTRFGVTIWKAPEDKADCSRMIGFVSQTYDEVLPNTTLQIYGLHSGKYCLKMSVICRGCSYTCPDALVSPFEIIERPHDFSLPKVLFLMLGLLVLLQCVIMALKTPALQSAVVMGIQRCADMPKGSQYQV
ncbi:uncharacterized protein LOC135401189 [Ornithodoros turicata]|uniref:uncharacterized protein LOC135401189 n=1 Tax=Ornithodoros turicata TaxID=34597 RepID=UPI0031393B8B